MAGSLLDSLERDLDDRPETPSRILRQRSLINYSNLQSPAKRAGGFQTPKTKKPVKHFDENQFESDQPPYKTPPQVFNPTNLKSVKVNNIVQSRNSLVLKIIDGVSFVISFLFVIVWGLWQIIWKLVRWKTFQKKLSSLSSSLNLWYSYLPTRIYYRVIYESFWGILVACVGQIILALRSVITFSTSSIRIICSFFKLKSLVLHDYYKRRLISLKGWSGQPRNMYRIKSLMVLVSCVILGTIVIASGSRNIKRNNVVKPILDAHLPTSASIALDLDKDGCGKVGCLVNKEWYHKLQDLYTKSTIVSEIPSINPMIKIVDSLNARMDSLEMQLDMKDAMLENALQSGLLNSESRIITDFKIQLKSLQRELTPESELDYYQYGPDYSLESAGGSVVSASASFYASTSSSDSVIQPKTAPGNCWGMKGSFTHS